MTFCSYYALRMQRNVTESYNRGLKLFSNKPTANRLIYQD